MTKINTTNDIVARITLHNSEASKLEGKGAVHRFCAASDLHDAYVAQVIMLGNQPFAAPSAWAASAEIRKDAQTAFKAALKLDNKSKIDALAPFKGNTLKTVEIEKEYRNKNIAAETTFDLMVTVTRLVAVYGVQPAIASKEAKAAIPAAFFLPYGAADRATHDRLMGDRSPWNVMLQPTSTRETASIFYFMPAAVKQYDEALAKHVASKSKEKAPDPLSFCGVVTGASVTPSGVAKAWLEYSKAKAEAGKANATTPGGVTDVPATVAGAQSVAGAQTVASVAGADSIAGNASQAGADSVQGQASQPDQRAPQLPGASEVKAFAVENASTVLMTKIGGADHKWQPSKDEAEALANLAAHVWLNPHVRAIFIAEQVKAQKADEADKRESKPAKAS